MPTTCTPIETISPGEAVCVVGFDDGATPPRPRVARATAARLATSKTVLGVSISRKKVITPLSFRERVVIHVAGDVVRNSITKLGPGTSEIVATITGGNSTGQAKLVRVSVPTGSEYVVGTCDQHGNLAVQPRPPQPLAPPASGDTFAELQVFNPKDFGATFDGETDDLPAFQAMHNAIPITGGRVVLPPGIAWLSDTWRISKSIQLHGAGGSNTRRGTKRELGSGFEVAPGRTALQLDHISADGNNASFHVIKHLNLISRILLFPADKDRGETIDTSDVAVEKKFAAGKFVRNGDCYIDDSNPEVFYRAGNAGNFGLSKPVWPTKLLDPTPIGGITWTAERFPVAREDSKNYEVGDRVYAVDDNRYLFTCTQRGQSADKENRLLGHLPGGDEGGGVMIGGTIVDGTVHWLCEVAVGIYVNTNLGVIEHLWGMGFTGALLHLQGGDGNMDVRGVTNVDNFRLRDIYVNYCGLGVYVGGSDANGWTIDALTGISLGEMQPTAGKPGFGGHLLHDHSAAGGRVSDLYVQNSTGRPILKNSTSSLTLLSCWQELPRDCHFDGGLTTIIGGTIRPDTFRRDPVYPESVSNNFIFLSRTEGRGIQEVDSTQFLNKNIDDPVILHAMLLPQDGATAHPFFTEDELGNQWAWQYAVSGYPRGFWALVYGGRGARTTFWLSSTRQGVDPGPGWLGFPEGYLLGRPDRRPIFEGHMDALTDPALRGGLRLAGDRFRNGTTTITLTSDGYRGVPWQPSVLPANPMVYESRHATLPLPGAMREPTANGELPVAGLKVFECTTRGTAGESEPNWDTVDGAVHDGTDGLVWTFQGFTPSFVITRNGQTTIPMDDKDQTLDDVHAAAPIIHATGTLTANRTLLVPGPMSDAEACQRTVRAAVTGGNLLVGIVGGTASVTIGAGKTAIVGFDAVGAYRVTADV